MPVVGQPAVDIELVRQATRRFLRAVDALTDDDVAAPCALPGWSRAELVTHIARNADGLRRLAEGAIRGEVEVQYPGGHSQRARDIAAGRGARARAVLVDARRAGDALMEAWNAVPDSAWEATGRTSGGTRTVRETVRVRLREVEVHHVDLSVGYSPLDWPVSFVGDALEDALDTLPLRAAPGRPAIDACYRIEATDHGRAWLVDLEGAAVSTGVDDRREVDAVVSGWGCDLLAWLYGRRGTGGTVTASGNDVTALHLSSWFPYP